MRKSEISSLYSGEYLVSVSGMVDIDHTKVSGQNGFELKSITSLSMCSFLLVSI
jgi:hypothetical protein